MSKLTCAFLFAGLVSLANLPCRIDTAHAQKSQWGKSLKGQVVFAGAVVPQPKPLDVNKDQAHCLNEGPVLSEEWVVNPTNKGMKNVFVWITAAEGERPPIHMDLAQIQTTNVNLDQKRCAFVPHALAIREGQPLHVLNTSPIAHNAYLQGSRTKNPGFGAIAPPNQLLVAKLKADTIPVAVTCNIHPWMKGWIRVFDHPYYSVTDAVGKFEIRMPPAGLYRIWYWHDTGWMDGVAGNSGFRIDINADEVNDLGKVEWKPAG